jgi:CMP/dCMP kinase
MSNIIIALDGYSSCGKSTTAKRVAKYLNYAYIDTGAMYRAVTLYFIQNHVSVHNKKEVQAALEKIHLEFRRNENGVNEIFLNGLNVENEIRKLYVANHVSEVSALSEVRKQMVELQRKMGKKKGFVMDGRDIGTVVFPEADLKIYMTADPLIRAHRRQIELYDKGEIIDFDDIVQNIKKRDIIDTTREDSPLKMAEDAILIDTTNMTLEEQVDQVVLLADQVIARKL